MSSALQDALKDKDQVKKFAKLLHAAIPLREAVQLNKRVNYFRGKKLIEVLLSDESLRKAPGLVQIQSKEEAKLVGIALLQHGFVHASEVANRKKRELRPIQNTNTFDDEGYFTWMYEGSKTMRNLLLALLVFSITGMCMFPIWPDSAKKGIWYLSVTLLIVLFVFLTVRLVLYVVFWSVGFEFWILPNFFDEDLGVADSFRPIVSFEMGNDFGETGIFRGAGLALLLAFAYWCSQQPTEFDELYAQQMDFLAELYDGKLLSDGPTDEELQKKLEERLPSLQELEKMVEQDMMEGGEDDGEDEDDAAIDELLRQEDEQEQQASVGDEQDDDDDDIEDDEDDDDYDDDQEEELDI